MNMITLIAKRFLQDEAGVAAIEYGLIASLIALVLVAALTSAGQSLDGIFTTLAACIGAPTTCV